MCDIGKTSIAFDLDKITQQNKVQYDKNNIYYHAMVNKIAYVIFKKYF